MEKYGKMRKLSIIDFGLEKGENSINTYDPYSMEFGEKQKELNRIGTRYLIFTSRMREFRIVDKYGKLPKDIISHSLLEHHLTTILKMV